MGRKTRASIILALSMLLIIIITPTAISQPTPLDSDYETQYNFSNQQLFISIQPSLYTYYSNRTHRLANDGDYADFITPTAVQSIADSLLKTAQGMPYSDEQFANMVLSVVHQIPYNITGAKYPIETLIDNRGDCGSLSILAASIMKAGGLDVVLIKYTGIDPPHMNIGVHLPHDPVYHNLLLSPTSFVYNNKTYWTAEATPQSDWKIGDQSYTMANAFLTIIPIDDCPQTSPGQVASNLGAPPSPSNISINVFEQPTNLTDKKRALLISGSIQPANPNSSIALFINQNRNDSFTNYTRVLTDDLGTYSYLWNITRDSTYYITACLSGNGTTAGMDSETLVVCIGPQALLQFQTDTYSYMIGIPFGDIAIRPFIGIDDFLEIPLGANLSVSYNFRVLQTGSEESQFNPINVTIPPREYTISDRRGKAQVIEVPPQIRTVPTNIPLGMSPLALPNDFNQTINSNFCVIIQKEPNSSYSLSLKGLNDYDVSNLKQDNQTGAFLNATQGVEQSTWYRVTTTVTDNGINAYLKEANGMASSSLVAASNSQSTNQLVLLLANNVGNAVVLRDFKIQAADAAAPEPQTPTPTPATPNNSTIPFELICALAALAFVFAVAATIYVKKKKPTINEH